MTITSVKYTDKNTLRVELDNGAVQFAGLTKPGDPRSVGDGPTREAVDDWLDAGNTPLPADPPPRRLSKGELIDGAIDTNPALLGLVREFASARGITEAQLRTLIKSR